MTDNPLPVDNTEPEEVIQTRRMLAIFKERGLVDNNHPGRCAKGQVWRHRERGTTYHVLGETVIQFAASLLSDGDRVLVYWWDVDGTFLVRSGGPPLEGRVGYRVRGEATVQAAPAFPLTNGALVVVYRAYSDGSLWVRARNEFLDGRFERAPGPPYITTHRTEPKQ
jgi:hypothetical protein